jgi:hypothetical protein
MAKNPVRQREVDGNVLMFIMFVIFGKFRLMCKYNASSLYDLNAPETDLYRAGR